MLLNQYLPLFIFTWLLFFSNICVASKRFDGESLAYFTLIPVWKDQESKLWQLVCLPVCLCCSPPYWLMLPVQVAPVILTYCCSDWRLFFSLPPSDAHDAKCWNVSPSSLFTQARWRVNTSLTLYFSWLWKKDILELWLSFYQESGAQKESFWFSCGSSKLPAGIAAVSHRFLLTSDTRNEGSVWDSVLFDGDKIHIAGAAAKSQNSDWPSGGAIFLPSHNSTSSLIEYCVCY